MTQEKIIDDLKRYYDENYADSHFTPSTLVDEICGYLPTTYKDQVKDLKKPEIAWIVLQLWNGVSFDTALGCVNQKAIYEFDGKFLGYDPEIWELIDVPEEYQHDGHSTKSLHYKGTAIDGIVPDCPNVPGMTHYRTYARVAGIKKLPYIYRDCDYELFWGCEDFQAFDDLEVLQHGNSRHCGPILAGVVSDKIIPGSWKDGFANSLINKFKLHVKEDDLGYLKSEEIVFPYLKEHQGTYYTPQGCTIKICTCGAVSEIEKLGKIFKVTSQWTVVSPHGWMPVHYNHSSFTLVFYGEDFINDTNDSRYFEFMGFVLNDGTMPFAVTEDTTLSLKGNSSIEGECCIAADRDDITLTIRGNGEKLELTSYGRQPCIGGKTNDNLSFGRWEKARHDFKEIIIDNVHVSCKSEVENFTIGVYGSDFMPKVTLLNGGTLDCPETRGIRVMMRSGMEDTPASSTKHSGYAVYVLN